MLPGLSLILGGPASGRTEFAQTLVTGTGRSPVALRPDPPSAPDRFAGWTTLDERLDIGRTLAGISGDTAVLLASLPGWLTNLAEAGRDPSEAEAELMAGLALCAAPVVVLSREPGLADAPGDARVLGDLNIKLATRAGLVAHVVAGLPQVLKGALP